tara:strand:+ start:71364 stop:71759 length:396 start_codon:yes stop_codon:yes gene_type:complete
MRTPIKVNSTIHRPKDVGVTYTFDVAISSATVWTTSVVSRQSTSALVPHSDTLTRQSRMVSPTDFWLLPEYNQKHFLLLEAPYNFILELGDSSLYNTVALDIKRVFCFAGQFSGRLTIRSEIEQSIKISYA